ncbi:alpha-ketoacid dehydrogenase subunit beta [Desulfovibrio aminophilus]|nr:alpha-ketoacid dehydrogenase subunit beta [Desulfovibrio aminophilus]MCM0753934.1 alpha-ketoacid dehydrogenase subunit beta [Desulfovibrio aminophilus]
MAVKSMGQAVAEALGLALEMDANVFLAGEGVGASIHVNPHLPTFGLLERFGPERVRDTPVSEAAIAGLAVGASCMGLKPVVEVMFFPFITLASDMIVNHAAKLRYLSGGLSNFPLTVRVKSGAFSAGCQHSHYLEAWLAHVPGLKVAYPSTPADAKGLLLSAIFDPDPVVVIEEMPLYWSIHAEAPEGDQRVPLGKARIARLGADATLATYGGAVHVALKAAEMLAEEGLSLEVVDLRSLLPLDTATVLASVRRTGRFLALHDATRFCGFGAELVATVAEACHGELKAPPRRVAAPDIPVPFTPPQEAFYKPSAEAVARAVRELVRG